METKEKTDLLIKINAETSYVDKTYKQAEHNINKWENKLPSLNLSKEEKAIMLYIIQSRKQNIEILKNK